MENTENAASSHVSALQDQISKKISFMPFADLMGFEMVSALKGEVEIEMNAETRHHNPMGTVNGGAICALADASMGMTMVSLLALDESFTTLEQKTNFLKPVWSGKLRSLGKVLRDGRTVVLVEARIVDEKGSLVAYAVSTCMKLRDQQARNREVRH